MNLLLEILYHSCLDSQLSAARALARLGFKEGSVSYLKDRINEVSLWSGEALMIAKVLIDLGQPDCVAPLVIEALRNYSQYPKAQRYAVECSQHLSQEYRSKVIRYLKNIAADDQAWARVEAIRALGGMGVDDSEAINIYRAALYVSWPHLQASALVALIRVGKATAKDVTLKPRDDDEWDAVLQAFQEIDPARIPGDVIEQIINLVDQAREIYPPAYRLLIYLGAMRERDLEALISFTPRAGAWLYPRFLVALSEAWFALGCHSAR